MLNDSNKLGDQKNIPESIGICRQIEDDIFFGLEDERANHLFNCIMSIVNIEYERVYVNNQRHKAVGLSLGDNNMVFKPHPPETFGRLTATCPSLHRLAVSFQPTPGELARDCFQLALLNRFSSFVSALGHIVGTILNVKDIAQFLLPRKGGGFLVEDS